MMFIMLKSSTTFYLKVIFFEVGKLILLKKLVCYKFFCLSNNTSENIFLINKDFTTILLTYTTFSVVVVCVMNL